MELHIYCQQNKKLGTSTSFPTESSLKCWQNIVNTLWSALRSWRENKEHWGGKMKWRCKPKKQAENGTAFILGHWQHQGYWWSLDFPRLMWHQRQSTGPLRRKESKNRPLLMEPEWEMTPPPPHPPLGLPTKVLPLSPRTKGQRKRVPENPYWHYGLHLRYSLNSYDLSSNNNSSWVNGEPRHQQTLSEGYHSAQ